ncbi:MAG: hypothetical protein EA384_08365 [Spirochaetaceae bacterium]|nr:MAG: hypothetical protein EA384_08365 [Spirochaetaceae bacterium]
MKKRVSCGVLALMLMTAAVPAWSQVTIVAPRVIGTAPWIDALQADIDAAIADFEQDIDAEIGQYYDLPLLAQGLSDAGATATHIGTQRSFIDYQRFAVVIGAGVAASLYTTDPAIIREITDQVEEGDLYAGAALQPIVASFGFRPRFISDRLYANVKIGYADVADGVIADGVTYNALSVGLLANYRLIESRATRVGFLRWRGLSVGTGVMYQRNELSLDLDFDQVTETVQGGGSPEFEMTVEPVITARITSDAIVVPLEATTGLRLLWLLDVNVGGGVDLSFGNSEITLGIESPVTLDGDTTDVEVIPGSASVDAGTKGDGPELVRPRLTAGLGLNLGPVKIDFPLMYYFDKEGNSLMAGVNVGLVF